MVPTYVFGNHDQFRSITRLDNNEQKAEVLAAFQFTVRGVPFVYYGEEIGMRTSNIALEDAEDPLALYWLDIPEWLQNHFPIMLNRDNCRTPMQWSANTSAGFSSSEKTWLPVQENYNEINVQTRLEDKTSIIHTYREILQIRNSSKAFKSGQMELFEPRLDLSKNVLSYSRYDVDEKYFIYLNFSDQRQSISIDANHAIVKYQKRAKLQEQTAVLENYGILIVEAN